MQLILIDESKFKKYILCAVEIPQSQAPSARQTVNRARKKGQDSIHFVSESAQRKKQILGIYSSIELKCTNYVVKGLNENIARKLCIQALIDDLDTTKHYSIIFDLDVNHLQADRSIIAQALKNRSIVARVEYRHTEPKSETLLWLPDALAWTYAKGSDWKRELKAFAVKTKIIS